MLIKTECNDVKITKKEKKTIFDSQYNRKYIKCFKAYLCQVKKCIISKQKAVLNLTSATCVKKQGAGWCLPQCCIIMSFSSPDKSVNRGGQVLEFCEKNVVSFDTGFELLNSPASSLSYFSFYNDIKCFHLVKCLSYRQVNSVSGLFYYEIMLLSWMQCIV